MSYTITIKRRDRLMRPRREWRQVLTDAQVFEVAKSKNVAAADVKAFAYVDDEWVEKVEETTYEQTVEVLDLPRVIAALNQLRLADDSYIGPDPGPAPGALDV